MSDGMLHTPELRFFIPSPLDSNVNIHGLGGQKHAYEGLWHNIPSRDCMYHATVMQAHLHPMLLDNSFALLTKKENKIGTNYSMGLPLNGESVSICVSIYQIKKRYYFDESLEESNMIPSSLINDRIPVKKKLV